MYEYTQNKVILRKILLLPLLKYARVLRPAERICVRAEWKLENTLTLYLPIASGIPQWENQKPA